MRKVQLMKKTYTDVRNNCVDTLVKKFSSYN